jgi:hypothetical protein
LTQANFNLVGALSETAIAMLALFTGGLRRPPNLREMLMIMTGMSKKGKV